MTVLPGRRYPDLINDDEKLLENSFVVPDAALADVPGPLRGPARPRLSGPMGERGGSATESEIDRNWIHPARLGSSRRPHQTSEFLDRRVILG